MDPQTPEQTTVPLPQTQSTKPTQQPILSKAPAPAKTEKKTSKTPAQAPATHESLRQAYAARVSDILNQRSAQEADEEESARKYSSISSYDTATKIEALKDVNLDPAKIENGADAIAATLNRWKTVAVSASGYTPKQRQQVAANYYDSEVAPYYKKLGIASSMPKELWLKEAYEEKGALNFKVENFYHSQPVTGLFRGLSSTFQQLEALGGTTLNMLGMAVHNIGEVPRTVAIKATEDFPASIDAYKGIAQWHDKLLNQQHADNQKWENKGFFDRAQAITESYAKTDKSWGGVENPMQTLAHDTKLLGHFADQDEFWAHVIPSRGFIDTATSMATEFVATLPLFGAIKEGNALVAKALGRMLPEGAQNLTAFLSATAKGRRVMQALVGGGEGLAYGLLTRPNTDKSNAWKDAATFAVMGAAFSHGGESKTLEDVLTKKAASGDAEAVAELKAHQDEKLNAELSVEKNQHLATPEERRAQYVEEHANNISVMGTKGQLDLYSRAKAMIRMEERMGMTAEERQSQHANMLDKDKASASPLLSARAFVMDVLNGRKITELKPEEIEDLRDNISRLVSESEEHLNRKAKLVTEANATNATLNTATPGGKISMARYVEKAQREAAETGAKVPPEQIQARATELFKAAQAKAAAVAEKKRAADPHEEAMEAADTRSEAQESNKKAAAEGRKSGQETKKPSKSVTRRPEATDFGLPANASASHNTQHIVYLRAASPTLKPGELKAFYDGMAPEDFEKELEEYFYPKDLKDAGVYFEHEHTKLEGKQNPNFLAFMYNFKDQMPKETAEHLSQELEDSLKFEKHFKGFRITEPQKWHYALQMYNHTQTFVRSAEFARGERNIFRSTQSDLLHPTAYQHELVDTMHAQNERLIKKMFNSNNKAQKAALAAYGQVKGAVNNALRMVPDVRSAIHYRAKLYGVSDTMADIQATAQREVTIPNWRF